MLFAIVKPWHSLLKEKLGADWLGRSAQTAPFRLTGVPDDRWTVDALQTVHDARWNLRGHTPEGLEAIWEVEFYDDTRAVECWGQVTHRGAEAARNIAECLTLNLDLLLPDPFGQPWVRSINGVHCMPNYFPPHDFAVVDRQLLRMTQSYFPLTLTGLEDGRSSGENLPCAILCDERQRCGRTPH